MDLYLPPHIHHAFADGRSIFLDVAHDRYFGLAERSERAFERHHAGAPLSDEDEAALLRLKNVGVLTAEPPCQSRRAAGPTGRHSALDDHDPVIVRQWLIGEAVLRILATRRLQRRASLAEILQRVDRHPVADTGDFDPMKLRLYARAFQKAAFLTRTRDQCLPCSLALVLCLRRNAIPARLIMGVSGRPFAAHCWVQVDDAVINDTLDHAMLFTPILAR